MPDGDPTGPIPSNYKDPGPGYVSKAEVLKTIAQALQKESDEKLEQFVEPAGVDSEERLVRIEARLEKVERLATEICDALNNHMLIDGEWFYMREGG